ncbi:MAG TPA: DUF459 domain-containing protein [Caulobacteraceae bacterium]|jgi:hypothetical protein
MSISGFSLMLPAGGERRGSPKAALLRRRAARLSDRGCVLMVGVGLGAAIGFAFGSQTASAPDQAAAPAPAAKPRQAAAPAATSAPTATAKPALHPARPGPLPLVVARPATRFCAPAPAPLLLQTLQNGTPIRIGVFGDSFGDGVWSALYRRFPHARNFEVLRYSKPATGFTRYQQLNLEDEAKVELEAGPVDIAIVNFGANDTQPLIENGHGVKLLGDKWKQVYAERYVALLRAKGATVYWMGLPKMRADEYDRHLAELSQVVAERMAKLGVPYIAVRDLSVDARGAYADYLATDDGKSRLMRAGDGIHMSMNGYARLAEPVARQIEADLAHARAVATMPDAPAPVQANCIVLSPASAPAAPAAAPAPEAAQ